MAMLNLQRVDGIIWAPKMWSKNEQCLVWRSGKIWSRPGCSYWHHSCSLDLEHLEATERPPETCLAGWLGGVCMAACWARVSVPTIFKVTQWLSPRNPIIEMKHMCCKRKQLASPAERFGSAAGMWTPNLNLKWIKSSLRCCHISVGYTLLEAHSIISPDCLRWWLRCFMWHVSMQIAQSPCGSTWRFFIHQAARSGSFPFHFDPDASLLHM
jgi:hypothetical protein